MKCKPRTIFVLLLATKAQAVESAPIIIYFGYTTQIHCQGKLYLSSVGNPRLVNYEVFPKELGCGALIQPLAESGQTDVVLKSSIGDYHRILEIRKVTQPPQASQLEIYLKPETEPSSSVRTNS